MVLAGPGLVLGALGLRAAGWPCLLGWIVFCVGFFGLIEVRVLCTHCPHYLEPGLVLSCWANRGSPKLWRPRRGPLSWIEKAILVGGFGLIWGSPLAALLQSARWVLLLAFIGASAAFFVLLKRFFCTRCINLACPLSAVEPAVREEFKRLNRHTGRTG